jgi:hypothetical protein
MGNMKRAFILILPFDHSLFSGRLKLWHAAMQQTGAESALGLETDSYKCGSIVVCSTIIQMLWLRISGLPVQVYLPRPLHPCCVEAIRSESRNVQRSQGHDLDLLCLYAIS